MGLSILVWGVLVIAFLIVEGITDALVSFWFAIGSLAALIVSLFRFSWQVQLLVFIVASVLMLLALRPLSKKYLHRNIVKTNADALVGKEGVVKEPIDPLRGSGRIFISGLNWAAKSSDDRVILEDTRVVVERIEGASLIVTPVKER